MYDPVTPERSAYASDLCARLDYQGRVNGVLLVTTRPRTIPGPMLTREEFEEMELAFTMGLSPEGFAARLVARDKAGRAA